MKTVLKHKVEILGVALICLAFASQALTLGRAQGAALVGQPLDMVVPVQLDPGEDLAAMCFDADVFHADTRQEASRVRVAVEATAQPNMVNVRVLSSAPIDEPVVTVYLRTGCGQKTTRRYVLLADMPSDVSAPLSALPTSPRTALPAAQGSFFSAASDSASASPVASNSAAGVKATTGRVPTQSVRQEVARQRPDRKAAMASPKRTKPVEKDKTRRAAGQPRLKLDPLELFSDRIANIDNFMTFAPTDDALQSMKKMQVLEADVKALRALATKNDASLAVMHTRLQQAESERFAGGWVYGLIALVLACLTAVAFLWNRQRRAHADSDKWWSDSSVMPPAASPELGSSPVPLAARQEPGAELKDQVLNQEPVSDEGRLEAVPGLMNYSGPPSVFGHNSEAELDVRQQAKFFVSLGQTDLAGRILKEQIDENHAPNPWVYLDLLNLFHSLDLKTDFQPLQKNFNLLFNGRVPEFTLFKLEGKGLESYPDVMARITAFWSTPTILEVLDAFIFQRPQIARMPVFDLAAFRDLLLLHDVARRVFFDADQESIGHTDFSVAKILPPPVLVPVPVPMLDLNLNLDLDLSDSGLEEFGPHSVAPADVQTPYLMPSDPALDFPGTDAGR